MVANDILQARAIGSFAATQLGANRYAALDDGTPYGKGLADHRLVCRHAAGRQPLRRAGRRHALRQGPG